MPHHNSADFPHFSRAQELLTIATEVLEVVERLPFSEERSHWVVWVESILDLIKPGIATDEEKERCSLARVQCRSVICVDQMSEMSGDSLVPPDISGSIPHKHV